MDPGTSRCPFRPNPWTCRCSRPRGHSVRRHANRLPPAVSSATPEWQKPRRPEPQERWSSLMPLSTGFATGVACLPSTGSKYPSGGDSFGGGLTQLRHNSSVAHARHLSSEEFRFMPLKSLKFSSILFYEDFTGISLQKADSAEKRSKFPGT